ncbi:MAG TPA: ATP-binding protein [Acidimicrobiales bacterium]|nr:ATP-binding protein [Acidimicrobiales bacterium]
MNAVDQHRTFTSTPASAGMARRFVEGVLTDAGLGDLSYTATLLVSELVANAVLHTGDTPIEVVVKPNGDRARIEVHDGSPVLPVRKNYSTLSGTGRGLMLVERMATDWGAEATATGKLVWFELDSGTPPSFDIFDVEAL